MSKALPSDLPIRAFPSAADFETFLEEEHASAVGVYVKLAKKSSGISSISPADAVEIALCFGWIDGRANSIDNDWWMVRYTPRRAKSIWSQKNVDTIGRLQEQGKMKPAGMEAVMKAQEDGRWTRAYAGPASITVPKDFADALAEDAAAAAYFETLNKSERYSVLWRIETASPKARAGRITTLVEGLARGEVPGAGAKANKKAKAIKVPTKKSKTLSLGPPSKVTKVSSEEAAPRIVKKSIMSTRFSVRLAEAKGLV